MKRKFKRVIVGYSDTESPDDLFIFDYNIIPESAEGVEMLETNYRLLKEKYENYKNKFKITIEEVAAASDNQLK